jgi:hypothetical protein
MGERTTHARPLFPAAGSVRSVREFSDDAIRQSGYLREGFASVYHAFRPRPPGVLLDALTRYAGGRPSLVVDLGSGTGLSSVAWGGAGRPRRRRRAEPADARRG